MAVLSGLLGAMAWTDLSGNRNRRAKILLAAFAAVYGFGVAVGPLFAGYYVALNWAEHRTLDLPGIRWIRLADREYETYEPIARFLREQTEEGEYIYVGVARHDVFEGNDARFYYLSNRLSCCRYSELHPGVADRHDQQKEIIRAMRRHEVRAAVLWQVADSNQDTVRLNTVKERRAAAISGSGATLLDEYISAHFSPVMTSGQHTVVWRKDRPLPEEDG
jgi:hypothetical protein